ncbi:centromere protein S-like [Hyposmocoma kahamanoa]|uniref:centromere protein S-like n=1 Tax=Hyposmocoma kahamanoa TaxID=1477025 RepID=UPI000E6D6CCD|nr:centromere protein S-like [Hyposmocoma kahamanoa]
MSVFENLSNVQKIRAAIYRDVKAISSETLHFLGLEMTKSATDVTAELVYKKLLMYGADLEAFSKHAKRSVINVEDVKLLVRRNPSLKEYLNKISPTNSTPKEKRRKTKAPETLQKKSDDTGRSKEDTRSKEDANAGKEKELFEKQDEVENMIVDNTIDLTFD